MVSNSSEIPNPDRRSAHSPWTLRPIQQVARAKGSPRLTIRLGQRFEGNYIYQFINIKTGERYIGETRRLNGRISAHISTANRAGKPSAKKTSQKLYETIKAHPEDFVFGFVKLLDGVSPRKEEVRVIEDYQNVRMIRVYNRNRGGGGPKGKPSPKMLKKNFDKLVFENIANDENDPVKTNIGAGGPKGGLLPKVLKKSFDKLVSENIAKKENDPLI